MIPPQLRAIAGVLVGIAVGFFTMQTIQHLSPYQPPDGVSIDSGSAFNDWVISLSVDAYLYFLGSFFAAGLIGPFLTGWFTRATRYTVAPLLAGFVLIILAIGLFLAFNHPEWLTYASCIGTMLCAAAGGWLGRRMPALLK